MKNYNSDDKLLKCLYFNKNEIVDKTNNIIESSNKVNNQLINFNIKNINDVHSFIKILTTDLDEFQTFYSVCGFLRYVSSDNSIRKACLIADIKLNKHCNQLNLCKQFYDKLIYIKNLFKNELDDIDIKFIDKLIINYERNGILLSNDKKNLLLKIKYEITKLENIITKYLNDHENDIIELKQNDLNGLPNNLINIFIKNNNIYNIPLNKINYNILMKYVNNSNTRKYIESFYTNKFNNIIDYIYKLIILRDKYAKILNYANHCDYKSFILMTKNSNNVKNFLSELLFMLDYRYKNEIDKILQLINKFNPSQNIVNTWDIQFYINLWKQELQINDNMIKEYFELNNTINKIFNIYHNIFNVNFLLINNTFYKTYSICNDNNEILGYLLLDLYSRDQKCKQIRSFSLQQGSLKLFPIMALIASFDSTIPILINFQDVISLFHEMCHIMHSMFGRTKYGIFSGLSVEIDFVETPAQMFDFLCWEKNIIEEISEHYINKNKLSENIINKIINLKNLDIGLYYKKHIMISFFDQLIYSSDIFINSCENIIKSNDSNKCLLSDLYVNLHNQIMSSNDNNPKYIIHLNENNNNNLPFEFINLLYEFDAQYYCSIWSRVLSADMYIEKIKNKKLNYNIGTDLINNILKFGGMNNAYDMICNYMKRKPTINGFISMFDLNKNISFNYNKKIVDHDDINSVSNKFSEINESEFNN